MPLAWRSDGVHPRPQIRCRIVSRAAAQAEATKKQLQQTAARAVAIISRAGLTAADFSGKSRSFANYFWGFVDNTPIDGKLERLEDAPTSTPLSQAIARDMKKRGFSFMGPTVVYAYMQAAGLVNDHVISCPGYLKAREGLA